MVDEIVVVEAVLVTIGVFVVELVGVVLVTVGVVVVVGMVVVGDGSTNSQPC